MPIKASDPLFRATIKARRRHIKDSARCEGCSGTLAACRAERGKDPTAPSWFGCCARGTVLDVPCRHVRDAGDLDTLLKEVARGLVRTVDEVTAPQRARAEARAAVPPKVRAYGLFDQGEWWKPRDSDWTRIEDLEPGHRGRLCNFLLRNAARYAWRQGFADLATFAGAPDDVVDSWMADDEKRAADPEAWMRGTKLYQAVLAGLETGK